jgi:3-hydroxyisobutyrate dehydrogenase
MCRSVIVKGMEALVTESLLAARYYGVEHSVLASLDNLFPRPDWPEHARYLISRSLQHGTRRAAEMREVGKTVQEAGFSPWMSDGTVERQAWAPRFDAALSEESLEGVLDAIRTQLSSNET